MEENEKGLGTLTHRAPAGSPQMWRLLRRKNLRCDSYEAAKENQVVTLTDVDRNVTNSASVPVFKENLRNQRSQRRFPTCKRFLIGR